MTNIDRHEEISVKFFWAFAQSGVDVLLEDTVKRYAYNGKIHKESTVLQFAKSMMPVVRKTYIKNREEDISEGLDVSCLRGIAGVAGVIASFAFGVDDMRLHFRLNILSLNIFHAWNSYEDLWEFEQAPSVFIEAIGSVEKILFQHQLVEFMVKIFSSSLSWLDDGEGESNIIMKTLTKLLYGNGTSVLVTTKSDEDWSWEPIYHGGEPMVGVVYDIQDSRKYFYQGIFTRLDRNMVDGDEHLTLDVHFIGLPKNDELWHFYESTGEFCRVRTFPRPEIIEYKGFTRTHEMIERLVFTRKDQKNRWIMF